MQVIAKYALRQIEADGIELTGADWDGLVTAALSPKSVDPRLLPKQPPRLETVRQVQRSSRFGLVAFVLGSGLLGRNGYSMLFERQGDRWVFLCVVKQWIS